MTTGEKIARLRRENNITQEQLAEMLGVSRQSVSKWESDGAYPETDKLIRLGELFRCSLDYLLKEGEACGPCAPGAGESSRTGETSSNEAAGHGGRGGLAALLFGTSGGAARELKSAKTVHGLPLWHIGKQARGIVAVGLHARGVIAVGLRAEGVVSLGFLSLGVLSFGFLSIGLVAAGLFALGLLAAGSIAAGLLAFGAVCFGVVSVGAVAVGEFSVGAMAVGNYLAIGDRASALIAVGDSSAKGTLLSFTGELTAADTALIKQTLAEQVPAYFGWARRLVCLFLGR